LSGLIIDERDGMPSSSLYRHRFGSLLRAYSLIGYEPDRDYRYIEINRHIREAFPGLLAEVVAGLESAGASVVCDPVSQLLSINGEFTASIVLARSFETQTARFDGKFDLTRVLHPTSRLPSGWIARTSGLSIFISFQAST